MYLQRVLDSSKVLEPIRDKKKDPDALLSPGMLGLGCAPKPKHLACQAARPTKFLGLRLAPKVIGLNLTPVGHHAQHQLSWACHVPCPAPMHWYTPIVNAWAQDLARAHFHRRWARIPYPSPHSFCLLSFFLGFWSPFPSTLKQGELQIFNAIGLLILLLHAQTIIIMPLSN